jgi:homogentisate 1,2-dioxygenase
MDSAILPGYMPGFGNDFETEALPGALPKGQNSPQQCAYGLYAEQLSGSPFTAPRGTNERSWLYRIQPSVCHSGAFKHSTNPLWKTAPCTDAAADMPIAQLRWSPMQAPQEATTFLSGMRTMTTAGDVQTQTGMSAGVFFVNQSMQDEYFFNADGELLVVMQEGALQFFTEFGKLDVTPAEICIIPRGVKFKVIATTPTARGYYCENYGAKFTLPNRGPIGANCLANPRDFKTPVAAFEDIVRPMRLVVKWCGQFYETTIQQSPLDVVAWHGNYAPYKYDLRTFSPVGAILFDHPDPSIFTVLTAPSGEEGTANVDFVIFPERWLVAEHSFRPPWYHMNIMSEFMGLIYGQYDARSEGFSPGGVSLHNCMLPHGPDAATFTKASTVPLQPHKLTNTLAFMFETRFPQRVTEFAATSSALQPQYADCWKGFERKFTGRP